MKKFNTRDAFDSYKKEGGKLDYKVFANIVREFHQKISTEVVKGYEFQFPFLLGKLNVIVLKRKISLNQNGNIKGGVDWGESNKRKKEILERGGIPLAMIKDDTNNITGNNGGEEWMCYHITDTFYSWNHVKNLFLPNHSKYAFKISWGNKRELALSITEDSELLYKPYSHEYYKKDLKLAHYSRMQSKISDQERELVG